VAAYRALALATLALARSEGSITPRAAAALEGLLAAGTAPPAPSGANQPAPTD
jgi:hypothetical protein